MEYAKLKGEAGSDVSLTDLGFQTDLRVYLHLRQTWLAFRKRPPSSGIGVGPRRAREGGGHSGVLGYSHEKEGLWWVPWMIPGGDAGAVGEGEGGPDAAFPWQ